MNKKSKHTFSPSRIFKSFGYAIEGFFYLLKNEKNFQIHLFAVFIVSIAGFYFEIKNWEWCIIILCFMIILLGEAMNSALEKLCDFVSEERQPLIKIAKDTAAAGVFIASIGAVIIAIIIFGARMF